MIPQVLPLITSGVGSVMPKHKHSKQCALGSNPSQHLFLFMHFYHTDIGEHVFPLPIYYTYSADRKI
jgi:hypothetical protein